MANMSYCRFENTLADLRDCQEALDDGALDSGDLSESEQSAAHELIRVCVRIAESFMDEVPDAD